MKTLTEKLAGIQRELNAPKGQHNKFGGYNYRSCEDILQAVKPLLDGLSLVISDDIKVIGERVYVQATATITDGENSLSTTAFAREALTKKGMDESQITGSASSYARKYALNGLLLIDDNKDADSRDNTKAHEERLETARESLEGCESMDDLKRVWASLGAAEKKQLAKVKDSVKAKVSQQEAA